ncbi:rho guanine nucleotide exchange factor 38 isoform X1 [Osmerus eperlanus]|uniref:rho guanine nucleotide exchange factor 38 isoform X1 n=1 Tax=Osmerus eperlanus TaxID=29151 RepID=UPI002E15EEFA
MRLSCNRPGPCTMEGSGKEKEKVIKRRNRPVFLRYLERRKTDTIVSDDASKGDVNLGTLVRRTQSDKTEYSAKLIEKMSPHDMSTLTSPCLDPEEARLRKMSRRSKVIQELVQTERDFLTDMELCVREVVKPLRENQLVDVDRLFTNMETVCEVSATLLHRLQQATAEPNPEAVVIGDVFIQNKAALEDVYKIYCFHHEEANILLKAYGQEDDIRQLFLTCESALKRIYDEEGKPSLLNMGSLLIKPVQRVMKYPLLLGELWQATPDNHPDNRPLQQAFTAAKIINVNINEFKRRKDLVMKYRRSEDEGSLRVKFNKLNMHSIRKKSDRLTGHLKLLSGVEPQVRDEVFDKEEKMFRCLEKAVKLLIKNIHIYLMHTQEMVSIAVQNAPDLENIIRDQDKIDTNATLQPRNGNDPYKHFKRRLERLVVAPLSSLQVMFSSPQKLIQKRYDKLLDYCSRLERSSPSSSSSPGEEQGRGQARKDYEALNAQLVEELQRFNMAARSILDSCVMCVVALLRELMDTSHHHTPSIQQLPAPLSNISEVQSSILNELNSLAFVRDNAQRLMERKVSFERTRDKRPTVPEVQRQSEEQRARLRAGHSAERLFLLKRNCNGCQEGDLPLLEGDMVALLEETDPHGSNTRWLVHTGASQGYTYSTFLKRYNPQRDQSQTSTPTSTPLPHDSHPKHQSLILDEDFDNLSLFVSGSGSMRSFSLSGSCSILSGLQGSDSCNTLSGLQGSDSCSTLSGLQGELELSVDGDDQQFYAVYAFTARCEQELTLQEYQHVSILQFSDLGGNKDWWLAEAEGRRGYVPANYLGKMSYA